MHLKQWQSLLSLNIHQASYADYHILRQRGIRHNQSHRVSEFRLKNPD
jgi:hypothetical protein